MSVKKYKVNDVDYIWVEDTGTVGPPGPPGPAGTPGPPGPPGPIAEFTFSTVKTSAWTALYNEVTQVDPTLGGFTVTAPTAAGNSGTFIVANISVSENPVVIAAAAGETINDAASFTINVGKASIQLISDSVSNFIIV